MAATITYDGANDIIQASKRMVFANLAGDTSYPTGGYAITPGQFGLSVIYEVAVMSSNGYIAEYIPSTGKIKIYTSGGGGTFTGSALGTHTHIFTGAGLAPHAHNNLSIEKELVTVTTNVGTLAAIPAAITMIYANAATSVGPKTIIPDGVATAAGQVAVNFATGAMTFFATDAVTQATVTYIPEVAGAGGGKGIQAISAGTEAGTNAAVSAGTPAGTIAAGAGGEVANLTDLSTALPNLKFIVIGA